MYLRSVRIREDSGLRVLTLREPLLDRVGAGEGSLLWVYEAHITNAPVTNGALL